MNPNWQLPLDRYANDPKLSFEARASRDYRDEGWWFVRGVIDNENWFVKRVRNAICTEDRYYKTQFAAREAAAVLNLEVQIYRRLQQLTISDACAADCCCITSRVEDNAHSC